MNKRYWKTMKGHPRVTYYIDKKTAGGLAKVVQVYGVGYSVYIAVQSVWEHKSIMASMAKAKATAEAMVALEQA